MQIIIDTREKRPYSFDLPTEVGALSIGDYSISGLEDQIAVERKEVNDLMMCLTKCRDRFERELHRGKALDYFALVIEASLSDLVNGKYKSQMLPKSVVQSLLAFNVRYRLPIFFCDNRKYAQKVTESLLCKYAREAEKKFKLLNLESFNHVNGDVNYG